MSKSPPYQKIVTEIKRRIEIGELSVGDRVPSTRAIVEEWGVAIATATKALTTLRTEGIVQATPRVGTVVARPPARPSRRRVLDTAEGTPIRQQIVAAAITMADAEGIAALSMRSVAAQTGMATMTLYRYVNGKDDLVFHMIDTVFADVADRDYDGEDWRARLEAIARRLWRLFQRHPWLPHVVSLGRAQPVPGLIGYADRVLDALRDAKLSPLDKLRVHISLYGLIQGLSASLEQEAQNEEETGMGSEEWMSDAEPQLGDLMASGRFPAFREVIADLEFEYDHDLDALFEFGLASMLDGVAAKLTNPVAAT
ncbi:TetR/AcrR family transcriptional regulator C-terminal domain-containing protein [Stackebrandtia nassauensis]|uniref:Transcriptional regulator, GntR family n=1 Tax=Stackebrandtia nassauensis (strain DSM 44728 / CIP 108903 / NRRL B-16338 / NBRC 102104 / LLR-40K-21) TaxID=446470 RepID=D3PWW3_STANL|nr:TetR/AcrR family transcriptional regulator C-terminal domain-containing protein [Stackebrandtia nassauensis]ADD45187.1 transcriptional regulator, GntR family [Stackebrandtia nassauensis DSM 44728]